MGAQNLEESHSQTVVLPAASMIAAHPSMGRAPSALCGSACRLPVRVLIASKYTLFREGPCLVLAQQEDMQVIGDAADGPQTLRLAQAQQPDIRLLDLQRPQAGELATLAHLCARSARIHVLILADVLDEAFLVEALQHGAMGYMLKTATRDDLVKAMHALYAGELWGQRRVLTAVLEHLGQMRGEFPGLPGEWQETLTDRECEVVTGVIRGQTNTAIATPLAISEKAVKAHLRNMFPQLNDGQRQPPLVDRCPCWREWMEADRTAPYATRGRADRVGPWRARGPPLRAGVGEEDIMVQVIQVKQRYIQKETSMNQMKWFRGALLLLLALGLATSVLAQPRPVPLNDSQEPGSMIVFPKFIYNPPLPDSTAPTGPPTIGGEPRSEFEISVVCPTVLRDPLNGVGCGGGFGEGFRIKIRAHWVCPADQTFEHKFICRETDFDLFTTVWGTVSFNPANVGAPASFPVASGSAATGVNAPPTVFSPTVTAQRVPPPPCPEGYLIAWVVDAADRPIKFDGLIGDGIIRTPSGAVSAYNATPIQAAPALAVAPPALIPLTSGPGELDIAAGGGYQPVPGSIAAPLRFEQLTGPNTVRTDLTLLTLDVDSNAPNNPTFVELDFFNANEFLVSTFWEFICWTQVRLTAIDPALTLDGMTTRKGLVVSGPAQKFTFLGPAGTDEAGPVTLLGLVTTEVTTGAAGQAYTYQLFNDSRPVNTEFEFKPQGVETP